MKQGNEATSGKQAAKRGVSRGDKVQSGNTAMKSGTERQDFSADEQRRLIAEAAYYRASARGFAPGGEVDDWLQAEAEVNHFLSMTKTGRI